MGRGVGRVVEVQVVEQARPGGGPEVPAEVPGQPEGHIGHKQGVLIAGSIEVMPPLLHGFDLLGIQQGLDTFQKSGRIQIVLGHRKRLLSSWENGGNGTTHEASPLRGEAVSRRLTDEGAEDRRIHDKHPHPSWLRHATFPLKGGRLRAQPRR